ncbi:MAG TPA: response regulator [Chthoniobacterales bacterium]|nr:response regulator [Chthoniobacterales bacterium]
MARGKGRVFVVEDHPATARGLKMFLEVSGYTVHVAHTMRTALQLAGETEFDVLLCDLNLPDGDGWQLMQKLRATKPPVAIAYSAFDEPGQIARSKAVGFVEHVVKGATPEELVAAIDRAIGGSRRRAEVAASRESSKSK